MGWNLILSANVIKASYDPGLAPGLLFLKRRVTPISLKMPSLRSVRFVSNVAHKQPCTNGGQMAGICPMNGETTGDVKERR